MAGRYVLSLVAAALIAGMLQSLVKEGSCGRVMKILCGLFLVVTALKPLKKLDFPDPEKWMAALDAEADAAVREGEAAYAKDYAAVISDRLEEYILDKAAQLGLDVSVELTVSPEGIPDAVTIRGSPGALQKARLEAVIIQDLGIPKEKQRWSEE